MIFDYEANQEKRSIDKRESKFLDRIQNGVENQASKNTLPSISKMSLGKLNTKTFTKNRH